MAQSETKTGDGFAGVRDMWEESVQCWRSLPAKPVGFVLFGAWLVLFHFWGNSTLGYTNTRSLFGWLQYAYRMGGDDDIGRYIPFIVVGLFIWKRNMLAAVAKQPWWPALGLVVLALLSHTLGYAVQQTRVSVVAFFVGFYGLMGWIWGLTWLKATFFPYLLLALCMPLSSEVERVTFPMRLAATHISVDLCSVIGIDVIQDGTRIFDPNGRYQYEVAAACSGIRSLTTTLLLAVIYAFVSFRGPGRRLLIIASAFPLAIAANVFRLTVIVLAAETFDQSAGNYVHESKWLSLLPYVPAFLGLAAFGRLLHENMTGSNTSKNMVGQSL